MGQLNQPNQSNISQESQIDVSPKPSLPKWSLILIIIAEIIVISVAGYAAYQYFSPESTTCALDAKVCPDGSSIGRVAPDCEFASCPEIDDPAADWQTYRNEEYGFEVKYPYIYRVKNSEWAVFVFESSDSEFKELYNDFYQATSSFRMNGAEFYIGASIEEPKLTISEWVTKAQYNEMFGGPTGVTISINGQTAVIDESSGWGASTPDVHQFVDFLKENQKNPDDFYSYRKSASFYNENTGVSVTISFETIKGKELVYQSIFDQILSIFKFIE